MAAITAAVDRRRKMYPAPLPVDYPMKASEAIVAGALVNIDSNGYAVSATESASDLLCVGVALETKTASATNGADSISVDTDGIYLFTHGTDDAAITEIGDVMYVVDNNTVDDAAATNTADIPAGVIYLRKDADEVWIRVGGHTAHTML